MSDDKKFPVEPDVIFPKDVDFITPIPQTPPPVEEPPVPVVTDEELAPDVVDEPIEEIPVEGEAPEDDETVEVQVDDTPSNEANDVEYLPGTIPLNGETNEKIADLLRARFEEVGADTFDSLVKTPGSWENVLYGALAERSNEEERIQDALAKLIKEDGEFPTSVLRRDGKTLIRTSSITGKGPTAGEVKVVDGDEALMAFETMGGKNGGGYSVPLLNSGITLSILTPTGNDFETLITNCNAADRELGTLNGAHYFIYADARYKNELIKFIQPLITNTSYVDWRKNGKIWSIIKLPDLEALVMTIAAMCYKEGFEGFLVKCTKPDSKEHPEQNCNHVEQIKANLFEMVVSRWSAMPKESIDFMVSSRMGRSKHTLTDITKYQEGLGLEGERISFGNITFVMKIPSVADYLEAGSEFLADIQNEIAGDNTEGQYQHLMSRYVRTFLPWISSVELTNDEGGVVKTPNAKVIIRTLEKLDKGESSNELYEKLRGYIDKVQLTYVGYPVTECSKCGYHADTPSGMRTVDPFIAFFTLAFLYMTPIV